MSCHGPGGMMASAACAKDSPNGSRCIWAPGWERGIKVGQR